MSSDTSPAGPGGPANRRSSITQAALSNLFQRGPSNVGGGPPFPVQPNAAVADPQRRRLSVSTIGLSNTSPTNTASFMRRGSMSTNSDSIDESAIEDDEVSFGPRTAPTTPFVRRMSFGAGNAMRGYRTGGSPGNDQQGFNWSEQLRSRAESSVTGARPSFSFSSGSGSPPRTGPHHDRAKSVSGDMLQPPAQASSVRAKPERPKPDAFQERILKGDFYMD